MAFGRITPVIKTNGTEISVPYEIYALLCTGGDHRREQRSLFLTTAVKCQQNLVILKNLLVMER